LEQAAMIDRPNRPRTFEEAAAAQGAADRKRLERAEHFMDPIREVTLIEDQAGNGDWRVEYFGTDKAAMSRSSPAPTPSGGRKTISRR
jgi:hypothetical protein